MRSRTAAALGGLAVLPLLLLTACDPGSPVPDPTGTITATPTPTPTDSATDPAAIPEDAVLVVTGVATSGSASVDFQLVVRAPNPFDADGAADGWAATTAWCVGEIDDGVISSQNFSFTAVEVVVTARSGTWPADTPLLVLPLPGPGSTIAATGDLYQVNQSTQLGQQSGSVPPCSQPALIDGPGIGAVHLGIPQDKVGAEGGAPFTAWANRKHGLNANLPGGLSPSAVTFSDCAAEITPLGGQLGAPTPQWQERFMTAFCVVGGATGGE